MSTSPLRWAALAGTIWATACSRAPLDADPCDQDGDGHPAAACGGDDCDDRAPDVHPGAPDLNAVPGAWTTTRVLTRPGAATGGTAIAVDGRGAVHLAHAGGPSAGLVYAARSGGGWRVEAVDSVGPVVGERPAIALDARGTVHLAYSSPEGMRHAARMRGVWVVETVDPAGRGTPTIGLAPGGAVHVAYVAEDGLRHATARDRTWAAELVDARGVSPSLAVGAAGTLHVSYASSAKGQEVARYATGTAGAWRLETASDTRSGASSLVLDRAGLPRIAFAPRYITDPNVVYLARAAGGWSEARLPSKDVVYSACLRLDGQDGPHVLFTSLIDLFYAVRTPDAWSTTRLVILGHSDVQPSFDLDGAGTAHVASTSFFFPDDVNVEYSTNRTLIPDGVDQDCDGVDGVDMDRDGHGSLWTGGDDCDDEDSGSPADCR